MQTFDEFDLTGQSCLCETALSRLGTLHGPSPYPSMDAPASPGPSLICLKTLWHQRRYGLRLPDTQPQSKQEGS